MVAEPTPAARRSAQAFAHLIAAALRDSKECVMLAIDSNAVSGDRLLRPR